MSDFDFWSARYKDQATWTKQTRNFILDQISLPPHSQILEVGCGSLAVLNEFNQENHKTFGLDIDLQILKFSQISNANSQLINADGMQIPYVGDTFDLCFCHYLLLWIKNPEIILEEMVRVTKNNSWICCFAEPDYLARIDFPPPLDQMGKMQNSSLSQQGVTLSIGRHLVYMLQQVNLSNIHWGIIGSHQRAGIQPEKEDTEWETIHRDLSNNYTEDEILRYKEIEDEAQLLGIRIEFIPTFYAYAQKI